MNAMKDAGPLRPDLYAEARRHLDLSVFPAVVRDEQGVTAARDLYQVLKGASIDPAKVPEHPNSLVVTLYRQPDGDAVVMLRNRKGAWVFSAETVARADRMRAVLQHKGKIEGIALPRWLGFSIAGMLGWQWFGLLLLPVLAWAVGRALVVSLRVLVRRWLEGEAFGIAPEEQRRVLRPVGWLMGSLAFWVGLSFLHLPDAPLVILVVLVKLVGGISCVATAYRACDVLGAYVQHLAMQTASTFDDMLVPLVRRTAKVLITILGVMFVGQNLNINLWSLFAGFSVVGAMIALAGQDMVKNFFGSLTVLVDRPFSVGDWVLVNGVEGTVEDVGFRSTRIRTFYNSLVSVPNSHLITAHVDNYGARSYRRYTTKINIVMSTDPELIEAFCEGIRELIRRHPYTRKDYYQVYVNDMTEYSLQILLYVFWQAPEWNTELRERHRLLVDIQRLARRLEVQFAYPISIVHLLREHEQALEDEYDAQAAERAVTQGRDHGHQVATSVLAEGEHPPPVVID